MSSNRLLLCRTARNSNRGGFTLVELLVVIGIIAILASVALGPITHGLESAQESAGMQTARTIGLSEFQYNTDNNAYPSSTGGKSQDIMSALVTGSYISDPGIFAKSKGVAYSGTITAQNLSSAPSSTICWDFFQEAAVPPSTTPSGLSTSDPDGIPVVFSTGQNITCPTQGPGNVVTLNQAAAHPNPFGVNGMAVCFKSNSAQFLKGTNTGTGGIYTVNDKPANYLFSPSFSIANSSLYAQVVPQ
ncbi:MAG: type II secretion system GspH family protein [Methylacidiphilales bacterium]|nr:type II secretion system GspH family protein [Candidatus Methylacidiphilales bacterium]